MQNSLCGMLSALLWFHTVWLGGARAEEEANTKVVAVGVVCGVCRWLHWHKRLGCFANFVCVNFL